MTHREFLVWLGPYLDNAATTGLSRDSVRAVRDRLEQMRQGGALQPFASRLLILVGDDRALDGATVAGLAAEVRFELAPRREATVVMSAASEQDEKPDPAASLRSSGTPR